MQPFLTIIVPVYKIQENYLRLCLDSLCGQTDPAFRVVLIDDGSPDHCGEICEEYAVRDRRFSVIHQENQGVAAARNTGMSNAKTEWISFVDGDDWVEPDYVAILHQAAGQTEADLHIFDYYSVFGHGEKRKSLKAESGILDETWRRELQLGAFHFLRWKGRVLPFVSRAAWNRMFRLSMLREHGLRFMASRGEDALFLIEVLQCTGRIHYIHQAIYHYRHQTESITNRYDEKIAEKNEMFSAQQIFLIEKYHLPQIYKYAACADLCASLYSAMRLCYFNKHYPYPKSEAKKAVIQLRNREPYRTAFQQVRYRDLSMEECAFVFFLKYRVMWVVEMLVELRRKWKRLG